MVELADACECTFPHTDTLATVITHVCVCVCVLVCLLPELLLLQVHVKLLFTSHIVVSL